jgi:hypothetical protein
VRNNGEGSKNKSCRTKQNNHKEQNRKGKETNQYFYQSYQFCSLHGVWERAGISIFFSVFGSNKSGQKGLLETETLPFL